MSGTYHAIRLGPDMRPSNGTVIASGQAKADVLPYWQAGRVVIGWKADHAPMRRLSQASLASVRRKRLRRKLERKHPLLAEQLFADEIAARQAFYAGERITTTGATDQ